MREVREIARHAVLFIILGNLAMCKMIVGTPGRRNSKQTLLAFYVVIFLIAAFKLYFVVGQDILAQRSNSFWYLSAANSWYWENRAAQSGRRPFRSSLRRSPRHAYRSD